MADDDSDNMQDGMPRPSSTDKLRHVYGPRPLSALLPGLLRPAFRRRSPAAAQLLSDWEAIVGSTIAAVATPLRLSAGTLTIACVGPIAMELQHVSDALLGRINGFLGQVVVLRLRFVQSVASPPAAAAQIAPRPPASDATMRDAVAGVSDDELRNALERLGRSVLAGRA